MYYHKSSDLKILINTVSKIYHSLLIFTEFHKSVVSLEKLKTDLSDILDYHTCCIDRILGTIVNKVLHHKEFQRVESTWRGIAYLISQSFNAKNIKICMLNVSWDLISKDLNNNLEFDQSILFKKIYENEFGTAGGTPFGLLIGDYYIKCKPSQKSLRDDISTLNHLSQIAASAFVPFITAISPEFFDLNDFTELASLKNFEMIFKKDFYKSWKNLRKCEDSRFIGLTLPHILLRQPYGDMDKNSNNQFIFKEEICSQNANNYLWGNACYAFGAIVLQGFAQSGWFSNIRGVPYDYKGGGIVKYLPRTRFEESDIESRPSLEVIFCSKLRNKLSHAGFLALSDLKYTPYSIFYNLTSIQKPQQFLNTEAEENYYISTTLDHVLCVSRFAHYLKIIIRDKIGSFTIAEDLENFLRQWLLQYTVANDDSDESLKRRYPLQSSQVYLHQDHVNQGHYYCLVFLKIHAQTDDFKLQFSLQGLGKFNVS